LKPGLSPPWLNRTADPVPCTWKPRPQRQVNRKGVASRAERERSLKPEQWFTVLDREDDHIWGSDL
jgi:hypothetical protein